MTRRSRVFSGLILLYVVSVGLLLSRMSRDLDERYRESMEDSLVDTAWLLASVVEENADQGSPQATLRPVFDRLGRQRFSARIYGLRKDRADLHVYVTDRRGIVLFDSQGRAQGRDFSAWHDVARTLHGEYGARSTRADPGDRQTSVLYVAAPIHQGRDIVGVVSVGKPAQSFGPFLRPARLGIVVTGVVAVLAFAILALLGSLWLVRPFGLVRDFLRFARSQPRPRAGVLLRRAIAILGTAFEDLRDALAGRHYVTESVQTLTHEIKSPLSAIHAAAELLQEPLPEPDRQRFAGHILRESQRIQDLIDRLLELSSLEARRVLDTVQTVDLAPLVREVIEAARPAAERRGVRMELHDDDSLPVEGDAFLLHRAVANLLDNAVEASSTGQTIDITLETRGNLQRVRIRDHGTGIPEYATARVFQKFYSLPGPQSRRKGTGLGLAFVAEIAQLHRGRVDLTNVPGGGAEAVLHLPRPGTSRWRRVRRSPSGQP